MNEVFPISFAVWNLCSFPSNCLLVRSFPSFFVATPKWRSHVTIRLWQILLTPCLGRINWLSCHGFLFPAAQSYSRFSSRCLHFLGLRRRQILTLPVTQIHCISAMREDGADTVASRLSLMHWHPYRKKNCEKSAEPLASTLIIGCRVARTGCLYSCIQRRREKTRKL